MNKFHTKKAKDICLTIIIFCLCSIISLTLTGIFDTYTLVPAVFTLAIFLISYFTEGYVYGVISSLLSMIVVNFAFTFPYFKINFMITENFVSAVIMLIITIMTSTLTTKLKQQEKVRAESEREKMRANLLRAVSHDLRTPLTTIYGASSAIIENFYSLSDEQMMRLLSSIKDDSDWLIGMVENLLSVTRIEDGNVQIKKTPVVIEELIDAVLIRFKKRYPDQKVEVSMPDDFIIVPMDSVLITQVIVNMLENAVQHAKGMTKLLLNIYTQNDRAFFEIIDDGCGIHKNLMSDIFTGYYEKKDAPADHQKHNMGIGLSVCASVIKAHDGELSVENLKSGGCCFRFSLKMEENQDDW